MRFRRRARFTPDPSGEWRVRWDRWETDLMGSLIRQLTELLTGDDPVAVRLFPPGYGEDVDRSNEYSILTRDQLTDQRLGRIARVEATLGADRLSESDMDAWLRTVNDLRLVLGTRLDIGEEVGWPGEDEPDAPATVAYLLLGELLFDIVSALGAGLPPEGTDTLES